MVVVHESKVFDYIRGMALQQSLLEEVSEEGKVLSQATMQFGFLGQQLCSGGFAKLWSCGHKRIQAMVRYVKEGMLSPPIDMRYLNSGLHSKYSSAKRGAIVTFWQTIYASVAETMPDVDDKIDKKSLQTHFVVDLATPTKDPWEDPPDSIVKSCKGGGKHIEEVRYLPKGTLQ